jgi:pimeloyl-ACP methyl ester carboxylesterase
MSSGLFALVVVVGVGVGLWLLSYSIEALRTVPKPPAALRWAPDIPIQYVEVDGNRFRFIKSGSGPVLVLLHTLRTQLDLFEKVIPDLSKTFTVYALDLPGHGYSDIPKASYDAAFFVHAVEGFLDKLDLRDVTLAGVSIGGSISLLLAARHNARVARVVAINPYDYAKGRGLARSSLLGGFFTYVSLIPVVGETVMRLRMVSIVNAVFRGGVVSAEQRRGGAKLPGASG